MTIISNGFIINPYYELLPDYKICPFSNQDIFFNRSLPYNNSIEDYFSFRFRKKKYTYTINGRKAIYLALKFYKLKTNDIVTIYTTTGNTYISSCVTKEIEKICRWSRKIESNTKLILVNHEFGYPYKDLLSVKKTGLPIIEDCAHSFFSHDKDNTTGMIGDFVIYSFPKMFPIQVGGLLVSNKNTNFPESNLLRKEEAKYIIKVLSYYIQKRNDIIEKRLKNYEFLSKKFNPIGLVERFSTSENTLPGVFMFRKGDHQIDLPQLKEYFYAHGIQCSVFYGEDSFFIPVHQALNEPDLEYFYEVMKSFITTR